MQNGSGPGGAQGPGGGPPENPIVKWYNEWSARTPLVTRYTLQMLVLLWLPTLFLSDMDSQILGLYIVNIPNFTILHGQLYRLILAPLYSPGFLNVLFICMSLAQMGTRLESGMGSTAFAYLMAMLGLVTNLLFLVACFLLYLCSYQKGLFLMAESFWLIVLALIVIECVQSPVPTRQLFMLPIQIPSLYFPLVLWALFSLFTGPRLDMLCSVGVGYLYGFGWLKRLDPSDRTLTRWESSRCLASIVTKPGYVSQASAQSGQPWLPLTSPSDRGPSTTHSTTTNPIMANRLPGGAGATMASAPSAPTTGFPGQGGHTLGGAAGSMPPKPSNARDLAAARAAKLQGHQGGGAQAAPSSTDLEDEPFLDRALV